MFVCCPQNYLFLELFVVVVLMGVVVDKVVVYIVDIKVVVDFVAVVDIVVDIVVVVVAEC